jgi:hypothetical protein
MKIRSAIQIGLLRCLAVAGALAIIATSPSMAQITFAQYDEVVGATQEWSVTTSTTGTIITTVRSCGPGDSFVQPGHSGTFSFIDTPVGPDDGDNLLSRSFAVTGSPSTTGAQFSSPVGSSRSSNASATARNLSQFVLTSAFIDFTGHTPENASFNLSSMIPDFATGTVSDRQAFPAAGPFDASGTGTFSSDAPAPTPEPATLALIGGGLIGLGILRRRKKSGR